MSLKNYMGKTKNIKQFCLHFRIIHKRKCFCYSTHN